MSKLETFIDQHNLHRTEGRQGLINLCTIVRTIGYKDPQYMSQLTSNASIGDLVEFIEDNPGAIEAIVTWIGEQNNPDWESNLKDQIEEDDEFEDTDEE